MKLAALKEIDIAANFMIDAAGTRLRRGWDAAETRG